VRDGPLVFVDTNVLIYLRDARDPDKQRAAAGWMELLWETRKGRISQQVLQEYYVTVTGKLVPDFRRRTPGRTSWPSGGWLPLGPSLDLVEGAWDEQDRWAFSFWDSLIVAAARAQGCTVLLTEDLSTGRSWGACGW
jgi:predicted nucleic acid-binding protein